MSIYVRRAVVSTALLSLIALAACETDDGSEVVSYTDSAGRSCTVDLNEISLTSSCDVDPTELIDCADTESAIVLSDDYDFDTMIWTRRSCTACVDRPAHQTTIGDCATVDCASDDDCLNREGDVTPFTCNGGICQH